MTLFPNLIGKCEGGNCPVKNTCVRHKEFLNMDPFEVFGNILVVPTNGECKNYIKATE